MGVIFFALIFVPKSAPCPRSTHTALKSAFNAKRWSNISAKQPKSSAIKKDNYINSVEFTLIYK